MSPFVYTRTPLVPEDDEGPKPPSFGLGKGKLHPRCVRNAMQSIFEWTQSKRYTFIEVKHPELQQCTCYTWFIYTWSLRRLRNNN